jgi:hypothetical protein
LGCFSVILKRHSLTKYSLLFLARALTPGQEKAVNSIFKNDIDMKQLLLLLLLAFLGNLAAQRPYQPMVVEGATWV